MFKIIQTIENNQAKLTIIPSEWEKNGILYWPRKNSEKLHKNANSIPEKNWMTMKCKVKRSFIPRYEDAQEELGNMLLKSDTEKEQTTNELYESSKKTRKVRTILPVADNYFPDYNNVAQQITYEVINQPPTTSSNIVFLSVRLQISD